MMLGVVVVLVLLCVSCVCASSSLSYKNGSTEIVRCIEKERQALLAFKAGLNLTYDRDGYFSSWNTKDCCEWSGVDCDIRGHVINLLLWGFTDVGGEISPSLLELRELKHLDLGNISFENRAIPQFFGSFTKLENLDLSFCHFAGVIPSQLGNLSNLKYLSLSNLEYLTLSDPLTVSNLYVENIDWLSRLSSLELLNMDGIDLSRAINWVDIIKSLPFLSHLSFSNCQLQKVRFHSLSSVNSSSTSIKALDFSSNGFTSSIYSWLFNLSSSLVDLDLSDNMLKGPTLEVLVDYMPFLQSLDLSSNQLNGTLTKNLGTLSQLEDLDLSSNSLTGNVSEAHFSNLSSLYNLDLSRNALHIKVSPQWFPNFQVSYLGLMSCNLGPLFPNWIRTQKYIVYLDISNTGISENIPSWFWDFSAQFRYLNLSSNKIGGTLPNLSSNFVPSPSIDLSSNKFEGPIPHFPSSLALLNLSRNKFSGTLSFLCQISNAGHALLSVLDISHNLLTGGLPDCLGKLKQLVVLNLAHNRLSGEIPSSLGSLGFLETLYLYNNSFSGELPLFLSNCERLNFLDVGENKLTGNVPAWIGKNISQLYILSLRSNKFTGTIPLNLCLLDKLQVLDLSKNNLFGAIPPCLHNLSAMVHKGNEIYHFQYNIIQPGFLNPVVSYTDYSVIGWQGRELEFGNNLRLLKLIDLSSNNFTGEIPDELAKLFELVGLNLSRNSLQGNIPQNISQLKSIQFLDLSRNRFSGKLPTSLSQLNSLNYLDLSYNMFSGKIPSGTQLQSFDASKFIGNVGLCGPPLPSECPGDESPPTDVGSKENAGGDDDEFKTWLYIGMSTGFITGFWGICGALLLNRRGRHALFLFADDLTSWFYVKLAARRF